MMTNYRMPLNALFRYLHPVWCWSSKCLTFQNIHIKFYLIFLCCLDLRMLPKYELRWFSESVVQFFIFHVPLIFMVKFSAFISDVKQHNQCWMIFGVSSVLSFTLQYMVKEEYVFQLWLFLVAACWVISSARLT